MGILRRNHQGPGLLLMGLFGEGNHPATGPQAAVEAQFSGTPEALQLRAGELPAGHQQGQGDGQIKGGAFLAQIGRCQVDHHAHQGAAEAAVAQGGADPLP